MFAGRKFRRKISVILLAVSMIIMLMPAVTSASSPSPSPSVPELSYLTFLSDADSNLITGGTQNINYRLWDEDNEQFSGSVTAYIQDADGHITGYAASSTSISNVTLDKPGTYTLVIRDSNDNYAVGTLTVSDARVSTSGSLITNIFSTVNVKLSDAAGNPLSRRSITVDATNVGGTSANYMTLYDGTFTIQMTPAKPGIVKVILGGHTVGTIEVTPAFTVGVRIGSTSTGNASLSVQVAQQGWATAPNVILTRDDAVADAMAAAPLSKKLDAPILMTPTHSLDSAVFAEIRELEATTVYIIGGPGAVSASVENALSNAGLNVVRIAGADRYDTASQIAAQVGSPGTVYMAYGYGEPDALAAGALAAEQGIPILLTETNSLPESTKKELAALAPKNIVLLGGTGVISRDLEEQLAGEYHVERWAGVDRYATQLSIFQNFFMQKSISVQYPVYITSAYVSPSDVSSGNPLGNAVVTAALAAKNNGFVIALPPDSLPSSLSSFLLYYKAYIPSATVVGNLSAISYNLEQVVQQGLAH